VGVERLVFNGCQGWAEFFF